MSRHVDSARAVVVSVVVVFIAGTLGFTVQAIERTSRLVERNAAAIEKNTAAIASIARYTAPWSPLGPFPTQKIVEVTDAHVVTEGVKNYREDVRIRGGAWWQCTDPPGTLIPIGQGTAFRIKGRLEIRYENPIPDRARSANCRAWKLSGTETPIDEAGDRRNGLPLTWETEDFSLNP